MFPGFPVSVEQSLAFHMPYNESGAQNDQKDYFPRIGSFHGSSSDDGDHDNQNRLEQICFLRKEGSLNIKDAVQVLLKVCYELIIKNIPF